MRAMVLEELCTIDEASAPLVLTSLPVPRPHPGELLLKISACGVCHTDLDEIEGRTPPTRLPAILGHQAVGRVVARGEGPPTPEVGERVGVAWIFSACGACPACTSGTENLCAEFTATGRDAPGGFAEFMTVSARFAHRIPDELDDAHAAPLLCAGAIGYRALHLTGLQNGARLGLTGFGASGHLMLKLARHLYPTTSVHVFARSARERAFARELGAVWTGDVGDMPPEPLAAIIDTTPVWTPVVKALAALAPGGRLVINAIRKDSVDQAALLDLDYAQHLWLEKEIKSVANVTRRDVREFLRLAAEANIRPEVEELALEDANRALRELKAGDIRGAKVLRTP